MTQNRVMKYLAIDIGAREVKAVKAELLKGNLCLGKVTTFKTARVWRNGHIVWDVNDILTNIISVLRENGPVDYIKIDSFHSDFILLDENDEEVTSAVSYLDERTKRLSSKIDEELLLKHTKSHARPNATVYQLLSLKEEDPQVFDRAKTLVFLADYINFLLTGVKKTSLTIALTSSLVNNETFAWDDEIINAIGISKDLFLPLVDDEEVLGELKEDIAKEVGFSATVFTSSHDSMLSYLSAPLDDDTILLSSGGLSRLGVVSDVNSELNLSGYYTSSISPLLGRTITKYLLGPYLIQNLKTLMKEGTSYDEIMKRARSLRATNSIDVSRIDFEEKDVFSAINKERREKGLDEITDPFMASSIIYLSLAEYYDKEIKEIENALSRSFSKISFVGGSSKDLYLAMLIALKTRKEVIATSSDSALMGNVLFQMITIGELELDRKDDVLLRAIGRSIYRTM